MECRNKVAGKAKKTTGGASGGASGPTIARTGAPRQAPRGPCFHCHEMGHIKENYPKRGVTHAAHATVTEDPSTELGLTIEAPHGSLGGTEHALAVNAQPARLPVHARIQPYAPSAEATRARGYPLPENLTASEMLDKLDDLDDESEAAIAIGDDNTDDEEGWSLVTLTTSPSLNFKLLWDCASTAHIVTVADLLDDYVSCNPPIKVQWGTVGM